MSSTPFPSIDHVVSTEERGVQSSTLSTQSMEGKVGQSNDRVNSVRIPFHLGGVRWDGVGMGS